MNILALIALWYIRTFQKGIDESFDLLGKFKLKADISRGDWQAVENKMSTLSPDEFSRVISELCSGKILKDEISAFLKTPETEFRNLIAGCYYTSVGYLTRSGAWANELSDNQISGMYDYMELAEEQFAKKYDNELYRLEAEGRMVGVQMLAGSKEDATYFFDRAKTGDPKHWLAHYRFFRVSTPRWGGSNEEMLSLINSTKDKPLRDMLRAMTLVEIFSDLYNEDEETAVAKFEEEWYPLIDEALKNAPIQNADTITNIYAKNYMAMVYNILRMYRERDQLIGELSGRFTQHPWAYWGMHCERDVKVFKRFGMLKF